MKPRLVTMSSTELDHAAHVQRIAERRTTQAEVSRQLELSLRQVEPMYAAYKRDGAAGLLMSMRRGRLSNRKLSDAWRQSVMEFVQAHYADFGPTLAPRS
jgi:transposase